MGKDPFKAVTKRIPWDHAGKADGTWPANETQQITASNPGTGDSFGYDVTISGNQIAVGAPFDDNVAADAGTIYIFGKVGSTWTELQQI